MSVLGCFPPRPSADTSDGVQSAGLCGHSGPLAHSLLLHWLHRRGTGEERGEQRGPPPVSALVDVPGSEPVSAVCPAFIRQCLPLPHHPSTTRQNLPRIRILPMAPALSWHHRSVGYWGRQWLPAAPHLWFASRLWVCLSAQQHPFVDIWLPGNGMLFQRTCCGASLTGSFLLLPLWNHHGFPTKATLSPSCSHQWLGMLRC